MDPAEFPKFFRALCQGEPRAAEELDRRYRPFLCQVIRPWLADARLRYAADSIDLCQVVMVKFLESLKRGRYHELETSQELEKLLSHIAKNAFIDLHRHERRGGSPAPAHETPEPADSASSPSQHVAREELEQLVQDRLSPQARQVHAWLAGGRSWSQIGAALNLAPNTARIRYRREHERVTRELGLEEPR